MLQLDLQYSNIMHFVNDTTSTSDIFVPPSADSNEASSVVADSSDIDSDVCEDELIEDANNNEASSDKPRGSRWKRAHPECWKKNIVKKMKLCSKKPKNNVCTNCRWKCTQHFTENDRMRLCEAYVGTEEYKRQKDFLLSNIVINNESVSEEALDSGRSLAHVLLSITSGKMMNVSECVSIFFMSTLGIGHSPISQAVRGCSDTGHFDGEYKQGKHVAVNKTNESDLI